MSKQAIFSEECLQSIRECTMESLSALEQKRGKGKKSVPHHVYDALFTDSWRKTVDCLSDEMSMVKGSKNVQLFPRDFM
jgi:hypothetical protein